MYKDDIYEIQDNDMARVSLDNDFGGMVIKKDLSSKIGLRDLK